MGLRKWWSSWSVMSSLFGLGPKRVEVSVHVPPIQVVVHIEGSKSDHARLEAGSGASAKQEGFKLVTPPELSNEDKLMEVADKLKKAQPASAQFGQEQNI